MHHRNVDNIAHIRYNNLRTESIPWQYCPCHSNRSNMWNEVLPIEHLDGQRLENRSCKWNFYAFLDT
jgi:hypothetical protein